MVVSFMMLVANDPTKSLGCRMEINLLSMYGTTANLKTNLSSACHNRDINVVFGQSPTQILISKGNAIVADDESSDDGDEVDGSDADGDDDVEAQ